MLRGVYCGRGISDMVTVPMKVNGYKCDVCGAEKREVNRWFLIWFGPELVLSRWKDSEADPGRLPSLRPAVRDCKDQRISGGST